MILHIIIFSAGFCVGFAVGWLMEGDWDECTGRRAQFMNDKKEIEELVRDYVLAVNALNRHRERERFVPGTRVRCKYRNDPTKIGEIAAYGPAWSTVSSMDVPVMFSNGRIQPWNMRDLVVSPVRSCPGAN